jgi:hypothetical protein
MNVELRTSNIEQFNYLVESVEPFRVHHYKWGLNVRVRPNGSYGGDTCEVHRQVGRHRKLLKMVRVGNYIPSQIVNYWKKDIQKGL